MTLCDSPIILIPHQTNSLVFLCNITFDVWTFWYSFPFSFQALTHSALLRKKQILNIPAFNTHHKKPISTSSFERASQTLALFLSSAINHQVIYTSSCLILSL